MFLVVVVSMIIDLVCWVWLKLHYYMSTVCLYAHAVCVCVAYLSVRVCLCVSCGI